MENECEALPGVAYPGVRDNRSTLNTKTGYDDDDEAHLGSFIPVFTIKGSWLPRGVATPSRRPSDASTPIVKSSQNSLMVKTINRHSGWIQAETYVSCVLVLDEPSSQTTTNKPPP